MLALFTLVACTPEGLDPDSSHWDVTVTAFENTCTDSEQGYQEPLTYSLDYEGSLVKLKIGYDAFATGTLSGCKLSYESQVIGEPDRPGGAIQWVLSGDANYSTSPDLCEMEANVGEYMTEYDLDWDTVGAGHATNDVSWVGVETFEIVASEDESIEVGCTYSMVVAGTYLPPE
jgi:hypothetical protein